MQLFDSFTIVFSLHAIFYSTERESILYFQLVKLKTTLSGLQV